MKNLLVNLQEFKTYPLADARILPEFLPPNLECLQLPGEIDECHVVWPRQRQIALLSGLAEAIAQGGFPKLNEVQCEDFLGPSDVAVINSRLAAVGVGVRYRSWPSTVSTLDDSKASDLPPMFSPPVQSMCPPNETSCYMPYPDEDEPDL
jgi:hypothetical protein